MAGKALKDVNSLCKCPACGSLKRMHHLCPYCMKGRLLLGRVDAYVGSYSFCPDLLGLTKRLASTNKKATTKATTKTTQEGP